MIWQNLTMSFFVIIICSSSRAFSEKKKIKQSN